MTVPTGKREVVVNVLDFGAVADGTTDCSAAFQRAVDALGPTEDAQFIEGGTVLVPAATNFYHFDRSVIVDHSNVRIVGEGPTESVLESRNCVPPLIFGLVRGTRDATFTPLSTDHWVDLAGVLDSTAFTAATPHRWGYRTVGPDHTATVTFPCSPFALGPRTGVVGWTGLRQFTVDFIVKNNTAAPWGQNGVPLFGCVDDDGKPSPYAMWISAAHPQAPIRFSFTTDDGRYREIGVPLPDPTAAVLRCSLQIDLTVPAQDGIAAWVDHTPQQPDIAMLNNGWASPGLKLVANPYASFNLGALTSLADGNNSRVDSNYFVTADLTFAALRLSSTAQYVANSGPQQTKTGPVTDLDWLSIGSGVFGVLPMDEPATTDAHALLTDTPVPDLQVPWKSDKDAVGYGLFQVNPPGQYDAEVSATLENVTVNCGRLVLAGGAYNYGQCIAIGHSFGLTATNCHFNFGAQGVSSLNIVNSYPIRLNACEFTFQTDAAVYAYEQVLYGHDLNFASYGQVLRAVNANVTFRECFCGPSPCDSVIRLINASGLFDNWSFDFEGGPSPSDSYFHASIGSWPVGRNLSLVVRDCQPGTAGPDAVGVRLTSGEVNGGLPSLGRGNGWCSIERSFTNGLCGGLSAVVAVDGPMWQGTFDGVPVAGAELVVTTASPGASTCVGIGSAPPAITVPRPLGPDPILGLPALLGYYQVDPLKVPNADGVLLQAVDGDPVRTLTDQGPAGNHGQLQGSPAIYETDAVNGHAALRFTGGWYTFPSITKTSGKITIFLVQRGYPVLDTNPTQLGGLRQMGGNWQYSNLFNAPMASSTTDWALYTLRYDKTLDLWANGRHYESRTHTAAGPLVVDKAMLGASFDGSFHFPGTLATAVVVDDALGDDQLDRVHRFLLHRYAIPV